MDTLSSIIADYHALGRKLQKYIDQLPATEEEKTDTLEQALSEIDSALDDMESVE
jgi:chaperonin cofactor prefoldin